MSESINEEFEAYVKAELGDIAVASEGRYISPKIQNYYKVWQHREAQLADAKKDAERYQWLHSNDDWDAILILYSGPDYEPKQGWQLDSAIDAAIAEVKA